MAGKNGGARPGAGRKSAKDEQELVRILRRVWKIKDREECFRKQVELAREGDLDSLKFLTSYAYGRPREAQSDATSERVILVERVNKKRDLDPEDT